jgi:predicted transcriptional regulator
MNIFLSHISNEGLLALVLKEWIQTIFKGRIRVFVSSDIQNITAGDKWLDNLGKALSSARVLIVLCSPYSVTKPWVNFEIGCAWVKQIPIIPICHSGQNLNNLPSPLSSFQGLDVHSPNFPDLLIQSLVIRAKLRKHPRLSQKRKTLMKREISSTLHRITTTMPNRTNKPYQDKIAVVLKKIATSNNENCTCGKLAKSLKMNPNDFDVYLRHLIDRRFIVKKSNSWYVTTKNGRNYLIQQNLL